MRPVRRLAILVLACLLAISLPLPAGASAVTAATERLQHFGILPAADSLQAQRAGAFITRAEFASLLALALGMEDRRVYDPGSTPLTDIEGHPAAGYVAAIYQQGYLSGYPDGTFRPEAAINYAEVVTVLARVSGVEPAADRPWPENYLGPAREREMVPDGLLLGPYIKAPAVRGAVFVLLDHTMRHVRDAEGRNLYQRHHDAIPPVLALDPVPEQVAERRVHLTGRVEGAATVTVRGAAVPVAPDGGFSAYVSLRVGANPIAVEAADLAGNVTRMEVNVTRTGEPEPDEEKPL